METIWTPLTLVTELGNNLFPILNNDKDRTPKMWGPQGEGLRTERRLQSHLQQLAQGLPPRQQLELHCRLLRRRTGHISNRRQPV